MALLTTNLARTSSLESGVSRCPVAVTAQHREPSWRTQSSAEPDSSAASEVVGVTNTIPRADAR
ncbi:MAG TPA: hypothetical protein VFC19_17885, partial [Candidatus Limnocylindrales bacterium]|nr:hypothetical protein [Candidatus Limnocylindrales bacterium]